MVQHKQTGLIMQHSGLRHNPNMKQLAHRSSQADVIDIDNLRRYFRANKPNGPFQDQ